MGEAKLGCYKHYSNRYYQLIGFAHNSDTQEKMVIYRPMYETPPDLVEEYGDNITFVRPYNVFFSNVVVDGVEMPRFQHVENI